MSYVYDYPMPSVTGDVVVLRGAANYQEVLLIRRGGEPFKYCWALPGGHIEPDEDVRNGACRELREETGLSVSVNELKLSGVYGKPNRDPRKRVVTVAYLVNLGPGEFKIHAGDDAIEAKWHFVDELPELAFDHRDIVSEALGLVRRQG